jgi:hypothetical protein
MEKGRNRAREDGKPGDGYKKGKDGSQDGGMGEGDAQALLNTASRGVRELNKQGFGGQSECFRADETDKKTIIEQRL